LYRSDTVIKKKRDIVAKLAGDGETYGHPLKLYVIRDKVLHRHQQSIVDREE